VKKFDFPLSRVMDWRKTVAQTEEAKLQNLYAELRAVELKEAALKAERESCEKAVRAVSSVTGRELGELDSFRRFAVAEHTRLEKQRAECMKRIGAQAQVVALKRRDVRLLEHLRETRLKSWTRELNRKIDMHAEEAYLSRWNRESHREHASNR
jgi:hypothetical protein